MLCAVQLSLHAQSSYSFHKDDTILRRNYYQQTIKKKELTLSSIGKQYAKDYKTIYEDAFKEIGQLWQSSRPVTSPEAHNYLQSLVKKVIDANPELKNTDARVVFSRDWWPNAVSMGDGSIAINAGLVVFMDNEAELVFVICHELAHYYLEHTPLKIKSYVEKIHSPDYQAELKRISKIKYGSGGELETFVKANAFSHNRYSREFETAADRQGFLFMKNTGYDLGAIRTTLELLDRIDDTSLYKPLAIAELLNFADYPFKKKWIQKESAIFAQVEDNSSLTTKEKDSLKTHPDCSQRIKMLTDYISPANTTGKKFIANEELFKKLRKDFFLEITEECYRNKSLSRNLYYNLLMLQEGENKPTAIYSIVRCLNEMYEKQKVHKLGLSIDTENKNYPEDYNLLLRMLGKLRLAELAELSNAFCGKYYPEAKGNTDFEMEMKKARKIKEQSSL